MKKLFPILLLLGLTVTACVDDEEGTTGTTSNPALLGSYSTGCDPDASESAENVLDLSDSGIVFQVKQYADDTCSELGIQLEFVGSFVAGDADADGVMDFDLTIASAEATVEVQTMVDFLNRTTDDQGNTIDPVAGGGWELGVAKDIGGQSLNSDGSDPLPAVGTTHYAIMLLNGDTLRMSDIEPLEANRPADISQADVFTRLP